MILRNWKDRSIRYWRCPATPISRISMWLIALARSRWASGRPVTWDFWSCTICASSACSRSSESQSLYIWLFLFSTLIRNIPQHSLRNRSDYGRLHRPMGGDSRDVAKGISKWTRDRHAVHQKILPTPRWTQASRLVSYGGDSLKKKNVNFNAFCSTSEWLQSHAVFVQLRLCGAIAFHAHAECGPR